MPLQVKGLLNWTACFYFSVLRLYIHFVVAVSGIDDVIHVTSRRQSPSRGIQSKVGKKAADRTFAKWSAVSHRLVSRAGVA